MMEEEQEKAQASVRQFSQSDGEPMADLQHKPVERIAPIGFRTGEKEGEESIQKNK